MSESCVGLTVSNWIQSSSNYKCKLSAKLDVDAEVSTTSSDKPRFILTRTRCIIYNRGRYVTLKQTARDDRSSRNSPKNRKMATTAQ